MKTVILAGGLGTRISEETSLKPKPMIEIGGKPVLWHIMKIYSHYGLNDFIICLGYKGYIIKEYFLNYYRHTSDLTINLKNNELKFHNNYSEPWQITLVDTGEDSMTGSRIAKIKPYLDDSNFCLTYGDGVADINIHNLIEFHSSHGKLATLTAVQPSGRFGVLQMEGDAVKKFQEKPKGESSWISAGFFVLSAKALDYIQPGENTVWEQEPLGNLAKDEQLKAYRHTGFWMPMDTLRDKIRLEKLWDSSLAPWKIW